MLLKPAISEMITVGDLCVLTEYDLPRTYMAHNAPLAPAAAGVISVHTMKIYFSVSTLIFSLYGLLLFIQYSPLTCMPKTQAVI